MLLQVRKVSTVISCTETPWENARENSKMRFKCGLGFGFGLEREATGQTQWTPKMLWRPKTCRNSNQTIHKVQQHTAGY